MATIDAAKPIGGGKLETLALPALLILGLLLYLPGLGSYGPLDPTDSFFIEGARELVETQRYLLPMFNYEVWLDKPILYFWLVAACYKLLGVSAFAGRLASALSAVFTGLVIYQGSKAAFGYKQAFVAGCVFLTFPLCSVIGHLSLTDMPLTLFMSAALLGFINYRQQSRLVTITFAYFALGLAFLCKGPVALIIVVAIVFFFLVFTSDFDGFPSFCKTLFGKFMALRPGLGMAIMLLVNLPWYGAATCYTNGEFFRVFFIDQNFGRMVGKVNHLEPIWYYLPIILGGLFPLNLLLFSHLASLKQAVIERKAASPAAQLTFFSLVWAGFILLLFTAIKTKLYTYILPAMPPLAVLTSQTLFYWIERKKVGALWPTAVLFALAGVGGLVATAMLKPSWATVFISEQRPMLLLTIVAGFGYLFLLLKEKAQAAFALLLASAAIGVGVCVPLGHVAFYNEVHKPFEAMIMKVIEDHAQIATVVTAEPSISYFLHRHIAVINTPAEAQKYLGEKGPEGSHHYLLVPEKCLADMQWFPPSARQLIKIRKWTMFSLD